MRGTGVVKVLNNSCAASSKGRRESSTAREVADFREVDFGTYTGNVFELITESFEKAGPGGLNDGLAAEDQVAFNVCESRR